jgi:hypothetical protein
VRTWVIAAMGCCLGGCLSEATVQRQAVVLTERAETYERGSDYAAARGEWPSAGYQAGRALELRMTANARVGEAARSQRTSD